MAETSKNQTGIVP